MSQQSPVFRMSLLSASITLSLISSGCGGAGDTSAAITEAAVAGTNATSLTLDETSRRRRESNRSGTTASTTSSSTSTVPTTTTSTTTIPATTTATSTTTVPTTQTAVQTNANTIPVTIAGTTTTDKLPLVQPSDLLYAGAFRFPILPYTGKNCDEFKFGGLSLAFRPDGNNGNGSIIGTGHLYCGLLGEFSIPPLKTTSDINLLNPAVLVQYQPEKLVDGFEGQLATSGIVGGSDTGLGGILIDGDSLIMSASNGYASSQPVTHWRRPLNLNQTGSISRPATVAGQGSYSNPRYTAGYMCPIPTELQASLGGEAITGAVHESIVTATSNGPSAFAFSPKAVQSDAKVTAVPLLFYPVGAPLEESVAGKSQQTWNWTSMIHGCVIPNGTRSIIFLGRHGTGEFRYGVGGPNGYVVEDPSIKIYDPADGSKGEHAWPYRYQAWAYDLNDLVASRKGLIKPESIKPYAVWSINLPFEKQGSNYYLGGTTYDPKTKTIFFSQHSAGPYGEPAMHALRVINAVAP